MMRQQRATALVPSSSPGRRKSMSEAHSAHTERTTMIVQELLASNSDVELPHIGPIVAVEKPVLSSWPSLPAVRMPTISSPSRAEMNTAPPAQAKLPIQLRNFIRQQELVLKQSMHSDLESIIVISFHTLDECCKRLGSHFPAYSEIFEGMQNAVSKLNNVFGQLMEDADILKTAARDALAEATRTREEKTKENSDMISNLQRLQAEEMNHLKDQETIRVIKTQNEDLFDQIQKMKRRVTEAEEFSQQITSRNVILQVNQGRLESDVERLKSSLEASISHHDADKRILEAKQKTVETLEMRLSAQSNRLENIESSLSKSNAELKSMMDVNKTLSMNHQRLQLQLQAVVDGGIQRQVSPTDSSRASSPMKPGSRHAPVRNSTPRPDWASMGSVLSVAALDTEVVSRVKDSSVASTDKIKLLTETLAQVQQKRRMAEVDLAALNFHRLATQSNPESSSTSLPKAMSFSKRREGGSTTFLREKQIFHEVFVPNCLSLETDDSVALHPWFQHPAAEIPRLEFRASDVTNLVRALLEAVIPCLMERDVPGAVSSVAGVGVSFAGEHTDLADGIVEESSLNHTHTAADEATAVLPHATSPRRSSVLTPAMKPFSFFGCILCVAEDVLMPWVVDEWGSPPTLPQSVSPIEFAMRSFIRSCQDVEAKDIYAKLFLYLISGAVPANSFLQLRLHLESLRHFMLAKKDTNGTGLSDPLTFTMSVKTCWSFVTDQDLDVVKKLSECDSPAEVVAGSEGSSGAVSLTVTKLPQSNVNASPLGMFNYLHVLGDCHHPLHQCLVSIFVACLRSTQNGVAGVLRSACDRGAGVHNSSMEGMAATTAGHIYATVGTTIAALVKWDPKRDKEEWLEYLANLLGLHRSDVKPTARIELSSVLHRVPAVFLLRGTPDRSTEDTAYAARLPQSTVPLIDTRELSEEASTGIVSVPQAPSTRKVSTVPSRRKSSVNVVAKK